MKISEWWGHWCLFNSAKDNDPKGKSGTFQAFLSDFSGSSHILSKDGPAFSPVKYKDDTTRKKNNVEEVSMLVYDVDDAPWDFEKMVEKLEFFYFLSTTWNHGVENAKFRLIFPMDQPLMSESFHENWQKMAKYIRTKCPGFEIDKACKDPSRLFFSARGENPEAIFDGPRQIQANSQLPLLSLQNDRFNLVSISEPVPKPRKSKREVQPLKR